MEGYRNDKFESSIGFLLCQLSSCEEKEKKNGKRQKSRGQTGRDRHGRDKQAKLSRVYFLPLGLSVTKGSYLHWESLLNNKESTNPDSFVMTARVTR